MNWTEISKQAGLTEDFIREHEDDMDWEMISKHQTLSMDFIIEYKDKMSMEVLKQNPLLSFTEEEWMTMKNSAFTKFPKHVQQDFRDFWTQFEGKQDKDLVKTIPMSKHTFHTKKSDSPKQTFILAGDPYAGRSSLRQKEEK